MQGEVVDAGDLYFTISQIWLRVDINQACQQGSADVSPWGCVLPFQRRNVVSVPAQPAMQQAACFKIVPGKNSAWILRNSWCEQRGKWVWVTCNPYTMASRTGTLQALLIKRGKCSIQIKLSSPQRYLGKQWHLTDLVVPAELLKVVYHASSSNVLKILGQPFNFPENLISGWWGHLAMRFGRVGCVLCNGSGKKNKTTSKSYH